MTKSDLPIAGIALDGGGRIGIAPLPGSFGGVAADVARIAAWGAEVVVTMNEVDEMARAGVHGLADACRAAGLDWRHMPIRDFGGPEGESAAGWAALSVDLHAVLDGGGAVLLHCKGGKGRSGMIALRLMVERGEDPEAALTRLRAVRPGAVETEVQFAWAARTGSEG